MNWPASTRCPDCGIVEATTICRVCKVDKTKRAAMKTYKGYRTDADARVVVDGEPFDPAPSLAVRNHSPDGFEWGYSGSGPAQLALALCLDVTADPERSQRVYQRVKEILVARFPWNLWTTDSETILRVIEGVEATEAAGAVA